MATEVLNLPLYFSQNPTPNVPPCITKFFEPWHFNGVRFLYDSFVKKKLTGAVLNHELEMNGPLQIAAFLKVLKTAIYLKYYALVICAYEAIPYWHYNMVKFGKFSTKILSCSNTNENLEKYDIIIVPNEESKLMQCIENIKFQFFIIDRIDTVALKRYVNRLKGQFNIGITSRNFYLHPDQKLQWTMLNWANKGSVGKLKAFYESDNDHLENMRNPYEKWWHRLTWSYFDLSEPPNTNDYEDTIRNWSVQQNLVHSDRGVKACKTRPAKSKQKKSCKHNETFELKRTNDSSSSEDGQRSEKTYRRKKFKDLSGSNRAKNAKATSPARDTQKTNDSDDVINNESFENNNGQKVQRAICSHSSNAATGRRSAARKSNGNAVRKRNLLQSDDISAENFNCRRSKPNETPLEHLTAVHVADCDFMQTNHSSGENPNVVENATANENSVAKSIEGDSSLENVTVIEETDIGSSGTEIYDFEDDQSFVGGGGGVDSRTKETNAEDFGHAAAADDDENNIFNKLFDFPETTTPAQKSARVARKNVQLINCYETLIETLDREIVSSVDDADKEILNSLVTAENRTGSGKPAAAAADRCLQLQYSGEEKTDVCLFLDSVLPPAAAETAASAAAASDMLSGVSSDPEIDPVPSLAFSDSDDNAEKNPIIDHLLF